MPVPWLQLPHFRQETPFTCTPACVRMVLSSLGIDHSEEELVLLLGTDENGTVLTNLSALATLASGLQVTVGASSYEGIRPFAKAPR